MTSSSVSLDELVRRGTSETAHYTGRAQPPATPLEWLGIAVTHIPELAARARTVDELSGRARSAPADIREQLLDAMAREVGTAASMLDHARRLVVERHPGCDTGDSPEDYSELVEPAHRSAPRRAEMMIAAYSAFLGGAIEAAGNLAEAELAITKARRWDRADHERTVEIRSMQLCSALTNALGGLLAYARLIATGS